MAVGVRLHGGTGNLGDKLPRLLQPPPRLSAGDNVDIWKEVASPPPCRGTAGFHSSEARGGRYSQIVYYSVPCLLNE